MDDLWPTDIATINIKAPLTILKEQASLLGRKTNNVVVARVVTIPNALLPITTLPEEDVAFAFRFDITGPAINNYSYTLFIMAHGVSLYPVYILFGDNIITIDSEERLIIELRDIFASDKARNVIAAILAQSTPRRIRASRVSRMNNGEPDVE